MSREEALRRMLAGAAAAEQAVARRRAALVAEFGWTHLEVQADWDASARALRLRGQVAVPRVCAALQADLAPLLPPGWTSSTDGVTALPGLGWRALRPGVTRLWRTPGLAAGTCANGQGDDDLALGTGGPESGARDGGLALGAGANGQAAWGDGLALGAGASGQGARGDGLALGTGANGQAAWGGGLALGAGANGQGVRGGELFGLALGAGANGQGVRDGELTSELLDGDGPVELLHALPGALLVRAGDGAVGWVRGALGPAAAGPRAAARATWAAGEALRRLAASLRSYRGVAYRLGGTTARHMDCSGLVQRCVREALGQVLPRHSTEQVVGGAGRALGEPGDLVFMVGAGAAEGHVGVVLRGARPGERTLIHASTRRGRVIEEPLDRCLARAPGAVRHVELAQVIEGRGR